MEPVDFPADRSQRPDSQPDLWTSTAPTASGGAVSRTVDLAPWDGAWTDDDPDANFKHDVALYSRLDPLATLENLSVAVDVPVGSLCRYVLAKWASAGAEALLTLGPTALRRMQATVDTAEGAGTDEARIEAYHDLAAQLAWLAVPLDDPGVSG